MSCFFVTSDVRCLLAGVPFPGCLLGGLWQPWPLLCDRLQSCQERQRAQEPPRWPACRVLVCGLRSWELLVAPAWRRSVPRLELWLAVLSEDPTARLLSAAPRKLAAPECGDGHSQSDNSGNLTWPLQVTDLTRYLDPSGLGVISFEDFYRGIEAIRNGGESPTPFLGPSPPPPCSRPPAPAPLLSFRPPPTLPLMPRPPGLPGSATHP